MAGVLMFTLSMPSVRNGKWSGEGRAYIITRPAVKGTEDVPGYYHYNFGDGWAAGVTAKLVSAAEARKARKKSVGFSGYDWMVDSILKHGDIRVKTEPR